MSLIKLLTSFWETPLDKKKHFETARQKRLYVGLGQRIRERNIIKIEKRINFVPWVFFLLSSPLARLLERRKS